MENVPNNKLYFSAVSKNLIIEMKIVNSIKKSISYFYSPPLEHGTENLLSGFERNKTSDFILNSHARSNMTSQDL